MQKMQIVCSTERSATIYQEARLHITEDLSLCHHPCENLRSYTLTNSSCLSPNRASKHDKAVQNLLLVFFTTSPAERLFLLTL
jgi:hypothetical protein